MEGRQCPISCRLDLSDGMLHRLQLVGRGQGQHRCLNSRITAHRGLLFLKTFSSVPFFCHILFQQDHTGLLLQHPARLLILYRQGRYQEAEDVFVRVNKAMPTAEHIAHFADNALAMGKTEMARAAYQRALEAGAGPVLSQTIQKRMLALDLNGGVNAAPSAAQ